MFNYRIAREDDRDSIKSYCLLSGINPPDSESQVVFIAEDKDGTLVRMVGVKRMILMEPLIAQNPMIGQILAEKALAVASTFTPQITILTRENEVVSLAEHYGFVITDKEVTVMKKGL